MPLIVDGVEITDVIVDGVSIEELVVDGVVVWTSFAGIWVTQKDIIDSPAVNRYGLDAVGNQLAIIIVDNDIEYQGPGWVSVDSSGVFTGESRTNWGEGIEVAMRGAAGGIQVAYIIGTGESWSDILLFNTSDGFENASVVGGAANFNVGLRGDGFNLYCFMTNETNPGNDGETIPFPIS